MDTRKIKKSAKKTIVVLGSVFIVTIAVFTYFSNTIDYYLLPHVMLTNSHDGEIEYELRTTSHLEYKNADKLSLKYNVTIGKVLVKKGQYVTKGQQLFLLENNSFVTEKNTRYLGVLSLENQLDSLNKAYYRAESPEEWEPIANQIAEVDLKLQNAKILYDEFMNLVDESGYVLAPQNMLIVNVLVKSDAPVLLGEPLLEYKSKDSLLSFSFDVSKELSEKVEMGSRIDIYIKIADKNGETKRTKFNAFVNSAKENEESSGFIYTASLDKEGILELSEEQFPPSAGDEVQIDTSFFSDSYENILTKACIQKDSQGNFIYIISEKDGKFYIETAEVKILEEDDFFCAIDANINDYTQVVLMSTKAISNGQRVIVDE
ncbi:hypothetical protein AGMMS50284_3070 [Clostridia bacterium]|nr:hypothetical protein AGMMS50284_3070 [Clostridia bacterium]